MDLKKKNLFLFFLYEFAIKTNKETIKRLNPSWHLWCRALLLSAVTTTSVHTRENPSILQNSSWAFFSWSEESQEESLFFCRTHLSFFPSATSLPFGICSPRGASSGYLRYKNLHFLVSKQNPTQFRDHSSKHQPHQLFLSSPQPRTAIWLHLKHFASHLLSLGRDWRGLLHSVILSQPLAGNGVSHGGWIAPWHLSRGPFPFPYVNIYLYLLYIFYTDMYLSYLSKPCWQFISAPNGHWEILMGFL